MLEIRFGAKQMRQKPLKPLRGLLKVIGTCRNTPHSSYVSDSRKGLSPRLEQAQTFSTTHWSVVVAAGESASPAGDAALAELCRTYWYPLYAFVRRKGHGPHDAQDLTQAFFARLLEKNYVARADRERGRFRTYLLAALTHFLSDEWNRARRQKRGGGREVVSFDAASAEDRYRLEPVDRL